MISKSAKPVAFLMAMALTGLPLCAVAQDAAAPAAPPSAAETAPAPQPAEAMPSIDDVLGNLGNISPFNLVYVVQQHWDAGDKLKAAFWFYIWQLRTGPWAELDPETSEVRTPLNQQMGAAINSWLAADPDLMRQTAERALSYETKLPLWNRRPEGIAEDFWNKTIAEHRTAYTDSLKEAFSTMTPEQIRTLRAEANLPVGTPADIGAPLPEEWR